jgi:hypothetical protein
MSLLHGEPRGSSPAVRGIPFPNRPGDPLGVEGASRAVSRALGRAEAIARQPAGNFAQQSQGRVRAAAAHWPKMVGLWHLLAKVPDWGILALFFALILLQAIPSLWQESATFDEIMRQLPGYLQLTAGEYRTHTEHPPLIKMLAALPLLFMDVRIPPVPVLWSDWARWKWHQDFLYVANDADRLVLFGRLAVLPLTLMLGCFVFRWSRELFGRGAATFALFLYSFEPNILAHGRLMNTDLGVACFFLIAVYFFRRLVNEVTPARVVWVGLAFGLALITKYSALLVLPVLFLLATSAVLSREPLAVRLRGSAPAVAGTRVAKLGLLLGALIVIGLIAYAVIWGIYGFGFAGGSAPGYAYPRPWEEVLPEGAPGRAAILWAKEAQLLPDPYLHGLSSTLQKRTRYAFMMGERKVGGWPTYFLTTFLLKTPLAFLLLLALAAGCGRTCWHHRRLEAFFLVLPPILHFVVSSAGRLDIGHRHILPIYPFLFVAASILVPWARQQGVILKGAVVGLAAWYLAASLWIAPHYLAYFNELIGGPAQGYRYLVDSNLDWGQDLKGLKRYMDAHGIPRVWLSYFGTASPEYYGIAYNYLPSYLVFDPKYESVPTPYVAISATNLQGVYLNFVDADADFFKEFRDRRPIAKIGYSVFVYRLD